MIGIAYTYDAATRNAIVEALEVAARALVAAAQREHAMGLHAAASTLDAEASLVAAALHAIDETEQIGTAA